MSTVPPESPAPNEVVPDETLHFDYPGADVVLRSCDSLDFRMPRLYIVNSSPVLREIIRGVPSTSDVANREEGPLPVVKLPEIGTTLYSLLTFIFPVAPVLPSTTEKIMELLAVAQKYQMDSVLDHIQGAISQQDLPFIRPETAFHHYFLAQKHGLHQEALQAARVTLRLSMTIEDLEDKLEFLGTSGAYLHELWKYRERVRTDLKSDLLEFRNSGLPDSVKALRCTTPHSYNPSFPQWLNDYIDSIAGAFHLFDQIEFENVRACHIRDGICNYGECSCVGISSQVALTFWDALTAVIHRTLEKAESTLVLVKEEPTPEKLVPSSVPLCLDIPDANIIFRSSDGANFRVHKSVFALSSPYFRVMLSSRRPPVVDGLPVVQLSENADLLNSLVSLLYPVSPVIPGSFEKVFALLAACQKYGMVSIQSNIRAEIKRGAFPVPVGAEAFRAHTMASSMRLIPEMENAASLTLGLPMTFESLGEELRLFKGRALCDLVRYRKRCRDDLVSYLDSFFNAPSRRQIWPSCPYSQDIYNSWLRNFFTNKSDELKKDFTRATFSPPTILEGYLKALKDHTHSGVCYSCIHGNMEGQKFYRELEDELTRVLGETFFDRRSCSSPDPFSFEASVSSNTDPVSSSDPAAAWMPKSKSRRKKSKK